MPDRLGISVDSAKHQLGSRRPHLLNRLARGGNAQSRKFHPVEIVKTDQRKVGGDFKESAVIASRAPADIVPSPQTERSVWDGP